MNPVKIIEEESVSTLKRLLKAMDMMAQVEEQVVLQSVMNPLLDARILSKQAGRAEMMQQICKQIQNVLDSKTTKPDISPEA